MRNKIIIVHPGIQHFYRLGNALAISNLFVKVKLYTWFTISPEHPLAVFKLLKKRIKHIEPNFIIVNFPIFELSLVINLFLNKLIKRNNGNTTRYIWQFYFACILLPLIYIQRKNIILILTETAAWPLSKYSKRWGIPVIIDFPSISHEEAIKKGISETDFGIDIKSKERNFIDYSLHCSTFAKQSYYQLTSAKKQFVALLGAEKNRETPNSTNQNFELNIACIANTEERKGIDLLLKAFDEVNHPSKKLFLIGNLSKKWILNFCTNENIDLSNITFSGSLNFKQIENYLIKNNINLHILPSRFDSFGMVVPETMMLGIPNIVSPFVGAGEMIEDGKNGFIMKDLSDTALLHCINQYTQLSQVEKTSLKENVLLQAKNMTWEKYNERVKLVFEEILEELKVGSLETEDRSSF